MLHFGPFKSALIWLVVLVGVVFALPNFFYDRVERANDARTALEGGATLTPGQQADLEAWPDWAPSGLVNLGLDLRGGVHLLVEVRVADVYNTLIEGYWPEVRDQLRDLSGVSSVRRQEAEPGVLRVRIDNAEATGAAISAIRDISGASALSVEDSGEGVITIQLTDAEKAAANDRTMAQSLEIIRRRVDESGTREPTIQRQGSDRIVIEVPGIGSAQELLDIIGQTAALSFHPVIRTGSQGEQVGFDELLLPDQESGQYYVVERAAVVTGDNLVDSQPSFDQNGLPDVSFRFDGVGARKFGDYTRDNIGRLFAIVLDDEIISAPRIQSAITGGSGVITGSFTVQEATNLSILLRAGALPAGINVLEQRIVGPELGQDSIDAGTIACIVAFVAVMGFMWLSYGLYGLFANVALLANVAIMFAVLSTIGATLTLPGIAGIVLTIGMAVDANVLIFERIREELASAKGVARAVEQGFSRAFSAILDANVTTLIAVIILFWVGSGPVRGFAVTLGIGVVTSVFTAIFVTRLLMAFYIRRARPKTINI
ncbi:protein translocase subunit SecD [Oceanicella sp. SM1341]|uniref:protein translocase subunit SecD n=1 Tax=Oceanicella sp. SM1341 TaxID=1548889 RepID=UPI000E474168|nr:protein translocase subunit SecD [Oceanicella sp. SM1341]